MSHHKAIVRSIIEDGFCRGDLTVADRHCAPTFHNRVSVLAPPRGPEGLRLHIIDARAGFPDLRLEILTMLEQDDVVFTTWRTRGTHDGPFMGAEPTGAVQSILLMGFWRFEGDELVEWYGNYDSATMLSQLGLLDPSRVAPDARNLGRGLSPLTIEPGLTVREGDQVASRWTISGTHAGPFLGCEATGRPLRFTASGLGTIRDGELVDRTEIVDLVTALHQIGALEAPAHPPH